MIRSYSSLLLWIVMIIGASLMLYHTSDKVHALDGQLRELNAQIEDEQKSLHVLKAEWVYLANPARIEERAKRHLSLKPTEPGRISGLRNLGDFVPLVDGVILANANTNPPAPVIQAAKTNVPDTVSSFKEEKPDKPRTKHDRILAALNAGRINDRMTMQHAASVNAKTDKLDGLIRDLGFRP